MDWALRAVARHLGAWWHAAAATAAGAVRHLPRGWADLRAGDDGRHLGFVACVAGDERVVGWLVARAPRLATLPNEGAAAHRRRGARTGTHASSPRCCAPARARGAPAVAPRARARARRRRRKLAPSRCCSRRASPWARRRRPLRSPWRDRGVCCASARGSRRSGRRCSSRRRAPRPRRRARRAAAPGTSSRTRATAARRRGRVRRGRGAGGAPGRRRRRRGARTRRLTDAPRSSPRGRRASSSARPS